MINLSENFQAAIRDYHSFLSNWYPQKAVLKLVGDRYKLSGTERSMLYRGVSMDKEITSRLEKLVHTCDCSGSILQIDFFNQLFTIISYLFGRVVFISNDDLLRDASEIHGSPFGKELSDKAIDLMLQYLVKEHAGSIVLYIDQQLKSYEQVSGNIEKAVKDYPLEIVIRKSQSVDKLLKEASSGILATSDSQIIDKTSLKVFDLAYHTLKFHFNPDFIDLNSFLD